MGGRGRGRVERTGNRVRYLKVVGNIFNQVHTAGDQLPHQLFLRRLSDS